MRGEVERIDFPDGSWWEFKTTVTRSMRKLFRKAGIAGFAKGLRDGVEIDLSDADNLRRAVMAHPEAWDMDAVDDAYLLHGTVAWSWPQPVNLEAIDALDDTIVARVLERLRDLYGETPEIVRKNLSAGLSSGPPGMAPPLGS